MLLTPKSHQSDAIYTTLDLIESPYRTGRRACRDGFLLVEAMLDRFKRFF